jgi:hypothetical protein
MIKNEKTRVALNRVVAFVIGGLLVFFVMNVSVVSGATTRITDLKQQLDIALYEPGKLLEPPRVCRNAFYLSPAQKARPSCLVLCPLKSEVQEAT